MSWPNGNAPKPKFGHGIKGGPRRGTFMLLGVRHRHWYDKEGMLHRVHGPASEGDDGVKHWMWHGDSCPAFWTSGPWSKAWAWRNEFELLRGDGNEENIPFRH